jgi:hypothetical protein
MRWPGRRETRNLTTICILQSKTNRTENKPSANARQGDKRVAARPQRLKPGIDVQWTQCTVAAQFDGAPPAAQPGKPARAMPAHTMP